MFRWVRAAIVLALAASIVPAIAEGVIGSDRPAEGTCPFAVDRTDAVLPGPGCPFAENDGEASTVCPFLGGDDDTASGCPFDGTDNGFEDSERSRDPRSTGEMTGCPYRNGDDVSRPPVDPIRQRNTA